MSVLLSCQGLTKSYSARSLFTNIALGVDENERLGLIGPNGSGKSTLLKILVGRETPDAGTLSARRGLRVGYVAQEEELPTGRSVAGVLADALAGEVLDEDERAARIEVLLARVGFDGPGAPRRTQAAETLSGGWRKRLALASALIREPDLLLLDEPTNHLDLMGVLWLEELLRAAPFAFVVVSHDRQFLENVATRTVELNAAYADGYLSADGPYSAFLIKREEHLQAQAHQQVALQSRVRREIEWLRRGARARTTKAKGRIEAAGEMIADLADLKVRNAAQSQTADMTFSASGRKTKELLAGKGLAKRLGERTLFSGLDLTLSPSMKLGLIGANGSGKTTLLRLLAGTLAPDAGVLKRADGLRVVWFDQDRSTQLNQEQTLRDALSPNGEYVSYRGQSIHVSAWAKRFLFRTEQLAGSVGNLSGGEQARVFVARLMLQPADLLLLDEPTNDLDIPTLEVLEDSLRDFPGALVLVSHDRYLLDTLSTDLLALDGNGGTRFFASLDQWEVATQADSAPTPQPVATKPPMVSAKNGRGAPPAPLPAAPTRLTASERRELKEMEGRIEAAEAEVARLERTLEDPAVASDAARLQEAWDALNAARERVSRLYERWEALEVRQNT
jgi:ATP-binding cassette subfamily F protein uup